MNLQTLEMQILTATGPVAVLCLLVALMCVIKIRRTNRSLRESNERIDELQNTQKRLKEVIEKNAEHSDEMSRRIVWLETRVRQPKLAAEEVIDDSAEPPKLNITERRHRVVTLASRGQSPEMIAATIGMLPGEVELILSLDQAAKNAKQQTL
jgi:biopolymer transport protein ExbB/TolQ